MVSKGQRELSLGDGANVTPTILVVAIITHTFILFLKGYVLHFNTLYLSFNNTQQTGDCHVLEIK